jgi:hypothetical protein
MKTRTLFTFAFLLSAILVVSAPLDSTSRRERKPSPLKVTTRLHTMGLFSYGGRLVAVHPVVDVYLTYARKTWGFQFFKAVDLKDSHTPINFALAMVNKPFHIGKRLTITPSVGIALEQFESFADHGSDAAMLITTSYKVSQRVTLEHSALGANLLLEPAMRDWVNRLRLMYSNGHLDLTLLTWHNNRVFDANEYCTVGASIFYSRLRVARDLTLQAGITGLVMPYASDERTKEGAAGAFITIGCTLN